jgi:NADH:ubiquinone oxidoreductase subunit D
MREMLESLYILLQLMQHSVILHASQANDMFNLITHATLVHSTATTTLSTFVEAGKGLFGITYSSNNAVCVGCHFRSPAFFNLQCSKHLIAGVFLSDVTAVLGSLDIVFGEIDR